MIRFRKIAMTLGLTAFALGSVVLIRNTLHTESVVAKAAQVDETQEAELRLIFTTDIHGQLNSMDYEQGVDYNTGGLARAYDLIMQARNERPENNTLTFDVGDVMYDYTTEYIFAENQKEIQPIYKGMAQIGYDAITLGNHDFEYGYDYIVNQLKGSGLFDKVVLSNVAFSKTGDYPFLENMLITREVETTNGNKAEVTVGIIGETIPTLSSKTENYTGVLKTEDIVANVKTQAAKLKGLGADVVVVLSHSGMGTEEPEINFKNVSYALTKIDDVDVVLCGHEHNSFPTDDTTSAYYKLKGVDKETNLVNGKNLVMANDRGRSIGLADLTLEIDGDDVTITNRVSDVRFVSEIDTTENKSISTLFGTWEQELLQYTKEIIGTVKQGETIQDYFGLVQDNNAIQLLNDARKSYAMRILNTESTNYKEYPIIAASTYRSFGYDSYLDYINIKDDITESDLASIQPYNNYSVLYKITGKQLKEWLEWSASAYVVPSETTTWTNTTMTELMKATNLNALVKEDWLMDWSNFYVFDGIEYTINPILQPRYDISGNKINESNRVHELTYNGVPITDDKVFILVVDKITQPTQANSEVEKQAVYKKFYRTQTILSDYIRMIAKSDYIMPTPDNNWKLIFSLNYKFIVSGPSYANAIAEQSDWYGKLIKTVDNYSYYSAAFKTDTADTLPPNLVIAPTNMESTGAGYEVAVNATDLSGIKSIYYIKGDYGLDYGYWNIAKTVNKNTFTVDQNGIYSVYAEDNKGNRIVRKIMIDNISDVIVGAPKVETYTNRKTMIKGTAESGTTVVFEAATVTYETKVNSNGTFSYALPAQASGTKISVYAKDVKTGRISTKVTVTVKRTGPNQPSIDNVYNNSDSVTGFTNDDDGKVIAIIGDEVYVSSKGGKELYTNATEIYDSKKDIIETDVTISASGRYTLAIAPQAIGTSIKIYTIDHINRVSRVITTTVKDGGPNAPLVYEVSHIEHNVSGNVTSSKSNTIFEVYAVTNGKTYQTQSDKKGNFTIEIPEQLNANQSITVYAIDTVNGVKRKSANTMVKVANLEDYTSGEYHALQLDPLSNKDVNIYGSYNEPNEIIYIATNYLDGDVGVNEIHEIKTDAYGDFTYELARTMPAGTKVYAMVRFSDGGIIDAAMTEVLPTEPTKPYLIEEITNTTKQVKVATDEKCKVTVQIGTKKYTSTKYIYDEELDSYVYTVSIGRTNSGTAVKIYARNNVGYSAVSKSSIIKAAPDAPKVNKVYEDSTTITGYVELIDVVNTEEQVVETEMIEDAQSENLSIVEQTNTKVYASIGNKIYTGVIDEDGKFTIKIKMQKAGTVITVWGYNKNGRGPLVKVKVLTKK